MTEEQIVSLGDFCAYLKANEHFKSLVDQFEKQIVNHMLQTEPHETKKREGVYASFVGVRDFLGNMDAIIYEAAEIKGRDKPAPSEDDAPIHEDLD